MAALFASRALTVKVVCQFEDGTNEVRKVLLQNGASTKFNELHLQLQAIFAKALVKDLQYTDGDGDLITISMDAELSEALLSGISKFVATCNPAHEGIEADWEMLGAAVRSEARVPAAKVTPKAVGSTTWSSDITFWVDGEKITISNPKPGVTLLEYLREELGVTSTKVGCGEGGCGICTLAMQTPDGKTVPINSCLRKLCAVDGCHLLTTKGLGTVQSGLNNLQKSISIGDGTGKGNGSQCGFCTPGWVMNMYALLEKNPSPSAEEVEQHFDGNLCRCTGYRPILSAFGEYAAGGRCCGSHQKVPVPMELKTYVSKPLHFQDATRGQEYYRPTSLDEFQEAQAAASSKRIRILCANTASGVAKYLAPSDADDFGTVFIDVSLINELVELQKDTETGALKVGAGVPIQTLMEAFEQGAKDDPSLGHYADHIRLVASVQIRSVGSWGGNIMFCRETLHKPDLAYFASDIMVILATAGAQFTILQKGERKQVDFDGLMDTKGDILLLSMEIPLSPKDAVVRTFKTMQRHVFSHPIVNFGAHITLKDSKVDSARIICGGAMSQIKSCVDVVDAIKGKSMNAETFKAAWTALSKMIKESPSPDEVNTDAYREHCAHGFLYKIFLEVGKADLPDTYLSALSPFTAPNYRPVSTGVEDFGVVKSLAPLTRWIPKVEAAIQATGEADYPSDYGHGAWFMQLVLSTTCDAKLNKLDASEALSLPGVKAFISAKDIPQGGKNEAWSGALGFLPIPQLAEFKVFYDIGDTVPFVGAILGAIVAETWAEARLGAKKVVQRYGAKIQKEHTVVRVSDMATMPGRSRVGCVKTRVGGPGRMEQFSTPRPEADLSVKGEFFTGPQIHFPLETQSCFVEPKQGDRYEVTVSGQWPGLELKALQIVLGVKQHQLHIKTPRCGGGFGSKLMHQLPSLCATAVSAHKLKRPIRFQNERSDECRTVGCRNGIDFKYNATFDAEGMLDTLDLTATSDVGFIPEWGAAFAANVHVESDGVYKWPTLKGEAAARPASQYLNTWARAPHTMQQALFSDVIMEHIAKTVGIDVDAVRQQNFYKDGDTMYDGSKIDNAKGINFTIPQMWEQVQKDANYEQRKKDVAEYNKANRWTKKGVAISAMKWNMAVNAFYNVNCHIVVYSDGTLHVTTDCVEIGQGLNTKVAMAIAQVLSIDMDLIHVGSNDTSITANDGATGGSASSEACAEAARMAAVILKESIQDPFQKEDTDWPTAVGQARMAGVAMVADGWYNKSAANTETTYVVYGTSCAEVLIDVLTGDSRVESVDIMMDQGTQINAAVDIGQIQGGYVMALGYLFSEEVKFDENGVNPHLGTWEYKIPTAYDIPVKFNTRLLKDSPNPAAVFHGSKAVAEPPMGLISATYLALKNAMYAAREEVGLGSDWFDLPVPCSPEVIREKIAVPEDQIALPK